MAEEKDAGGWGDHGEAEWYEMRIRLKIKKKMPALVWVKVRATFPLSSLVMFSWQKSLSDCSSLAPSLRTLYLFLS